MKTLAYLRAARACRISDISTPSSFKIPPGKRLASWASLLVLILVPATILATASESQAKGCCKGRYRAVSYSKPHYRRHHGGGGLELGSEGPAVATLQRRLTEAGFPVWVDGVFGYETDQAVRAFQAANGLVPDGVVGRATAQALRYDSGGGYAYSTCGRPSCGEPIPPTSDRFPKTSKYVVAVPSDNPDKLRRVRRFAPEAFLASSRLGDYINAGEFVSEAPAEARAAELRAFGLDAQVRYREF